MPGTNGGKLSLTAASPEAITKAVCAVMRVPPGELRHKRAQSVARILYLYLLKHDTTLMAKEIAAMADMSAVGFKSIMSKPKQELHNDKRFSKQCTAIRKHYAKL